MATLYNPPAPGANKYKYAQRIQTEDVSTFMEVSDVEKIDMILESPTGAFKGNFDNNIIRPVNYRVLGTLGMVTITYLYSCGGLNGTETIVTAGGPSIALICLVVFPIIAAIPYAYIVAELCSAFPEDGGFTIWVLNAFGPFWAFQVGWWSWLCGLFRSALVPTFILDTTLRYFNKSTLDNEGVEWVIKACIGLLLALPTIFGTIPVSRLTTLLVGIIAIIYLIYTIWALTSPSHYDDIVEVRHTNDTYDAAIVDVVQDGEVYIDWDTLINVMFYKFDGVYMASVFGGEVMNPARTYPRAILFTMLLTIGTYFLPLPATMMSDKLTWLQFRDSSFYVLGDIIGGKPLKVMMFIATIAASIGTFTSGLYIKGFMISGMANNRLLHASLARRSERFEAPTNAILLTTVCTLALCAVELEDLLILSNAFASVVQFMIIIAAMRLRMTLPYIPRPTKVPGGIPGLMIFALVPAAVLVYVVFDLFNDSIVRGVLLIGLAVVGIAYGFWAVRWK